MAMEFTTQDGKRLVGTFIRAYNAFEGGVRYILKVNGKEYRCVKDANGDLVEYVA